MPDAPTPRTKTTTRKTSPDTLSADERSALKDRAAELKTAGRRRGSVGKADQAAADAKDVLDAIARMDDVDRDLAERVHAVITAAAPELAPKTWYGMPAYAKDGKVVCFFQGSQKFRARYSTLGFNDPANLDDGSMWPTAYAIKKLTKSDEAAITKLIEKALS